VTAQCKLVRLQMGQQKLGVVDTPGFDDTSRTDEDILDEIVGFLVYQYELGIKLRGIIYLHRITDVRMQGSAQRYFEMFKRLCGEKNLGHVVLITTMWDQLAQRGIGLRREDELRKDFWKEMEDKGSQIRIFDGSRGMANALVCRMMRKKPIVLRIQEELVDEEKTLAETEAGKYILPKIAARVQEKEEEIAKLDNKLSLIPSSDIAERNRLQKQRHDLQIQKKKDEDKKEKMKEKPGKKLKERLNEKRKSKVWKDRFQIFAAVVGVGITATVQLILPLCGVALV
jgi:hypothetical protein